MVTGTLPVNPPAKPTKAPMMVKVNESTCIFLIAPLGRRTMYIWFPYKPADGSSFQIRRAVAFEVNH